MFAGSSTISNPHLGTRQKDTYGFLIDRSEEALRPEVRLWTEKYYSSTIPSRLERWKRYSSTHGEVFKKDDPSLADLVREGIPAEFRSEVWWQVSGAAEKQKTESADYYSKLLTTTPPTDCPYIAQIEKDLRRTFPGHDFFAERSSSSSSAQDQYSLTDDPLDESAAISSSPAKHSTLLPTSSPLIDDMTNIGSLRRVLVAYSYRNSDVGYCQSMNFIAGLLLVFVRDEQRAFWLLCAIIEDLLPVEFFSARMASLQVDQRVLDTLLDLTAPDVGAFLKLHSIPFNLVSAQWLLCLYVNTVPTETVLRIWDVMLLEGCTILFRVAISFAVIAKRHLMSPASDIPNILSTLKHIAQTSFNCEYLLWLCYNHEVIQSISAKQVETLRKSFAGPVLGHIQSTDERRKQLMSQRSPRRDVVQNYN